MSKAKTRTYAVYYADNTYLTLDLKVSDYKKLAQAMTSYQEVVELSIGVFNLKDVRAVILQRSEPEKLNEKQRPDGFPTLSQEEIAYLHEAGVLANGKE